MPFGLGIDMRSFRPGLSSIRLYRPRLLPVTIAAMSALLAVKSVIMVQAVAGEAIAPAQADARPSSTEVNRPVPPSPAPGLPVPGQAPVAVKPATPAPAAPMGEAERTILMDLRHRHEVLDARALNLDLREAELSAADHRLADRIQQLSALQAKLENLENNRKRHTEENWTGLVKVYEAMKPRDAASIFDALDMQVLLQVLDRMQDRRAAPVLAAMQPDRARLATQMLAEMRTKNVTPQ